MSLREPEQKPGIKSEYVVSPNGRIFRNNKNLAHQSHMQPINLQGFTNPVPETVEQLEKMIADSLKKADKPAEKQIDTGTSDDIFDYSKATKAQIAKKAKERFDADLEIDDKEVTEVRKEYELLLKTLGELDDNTGADAD